MDFKADLIIFGATGFTGKYLVEECTNLRSTQFTWAIAGRNGEKMREVLEKISLKTGTLYTLLQRRSISSIDFHL